MKRPFLLVLPCLCITFAWAARGEDLAEVVVTARRVPEDGRRVPLAIDVAPADRIGAGGISGMDALAAAFPGLAFESMWGGSNAAPILRGLSQPSTAGDNVGVFIDDVYQAGRSAMDVEPLDLDRIEVLRGPQNTQFGRSTFAGAIRYVPAPPTADPLYRLKLDLGSGGFAGVGGTWSQRVGDSRWLARIAAAYRTSGGTWRSAAGDTLGDARRTSMAVTLATDPQGIAGNHVSLHARIDDGAFGTPAAATLGPEDFNCGAQGAGPGYWTSYCGQVPLQRSLSVSSGLPDSHTRASQLALHLERSLGEAALRGQVSFQRARASAFRDFDGSAQGFWSGVCSVQVNCTTSGAGSQVTRFAWPNVVSRSGQTVDDWAAELRLGRESGPGVHWMAGISGAHSGARSTAAFGADRGDLQAGEQLVSIVATNPLRVGQASPLNRALVEDSTAAQVLQSDIRSPASSLAAFGMVDFPVDDRVRMRLEMRAEREWQTVRPVYANFAPVTDSPLPRMPFSELTPRISLEFPAFDDWYGYASLARGARSGGVNTVPGLDAAEQRYEPEFNWTTETGLRYSGGGILQRLQLTLYRVEWRNAQIMGLATTPGINSLVTTNTAGISSRGIEATMQLRAGRLLAATVAWSHADARFRDGSDDPGSRALCGLTLQPPSSDFCDFGPPRSPTGSTITLVPYLDGNRTARAPRSSWNFSLQLQPLPVGAGWTAAAELQLSVQGDSFERPVNGARYGARQLLGLHAGLRRDAWEFALWGSNLTDERYVRTSASRGGNFYPSLPRPSDLLYGERRRAGITVSYAVGGGGS